MAAGDALVIVDVQNDFLPGGSLAIPAAHEVVPILDRAIAAAEASGVAVLATRDWHPAGHCSFRERGGPWPPHCVIGTRGAAFSDQLALPPTVVVVSKGSDPDRDAYSGFEGTDLDARLRGLGARRLWVGGLATDYCVRSTVTDALHKGYEVALLTQAIRAVEQAGGAQAEAEMLRLGAVPRAVEELDQARR